MIYFTYLHRLPILFPLPSLTISHVDFTKGILEQKSRHSINHSSVRPPLPILLYNLQLVACHLLSLHTHDQFCHRRLPLSTNQIETWLRFLKKHLLLQKIRKRPLQLRVGKRLHEKKKSRWFVRKRCNVTVTASNDKEMSSSVINRNLPCSSIKSLLSIQLPNSFLDEK